MKIKIILLLFFFSLYPLWQTAATYTVDNNAADTDDRNYSAGNLTLREAVNLSNASSGVADIINFNLGSAGPYTITLSSALTLSDASGVYINGFSNPNAATNPVAVFDATAGNPLNPTHKIILANSGAATNCFNVTGNNNTIRGVVITGFGVPGVSTDEIGINITGNSNSVLGCYIGMNANGTTYGNNMAVGIQISGSSNAIGDGTAAGANLISGTIGGSSDYYAGINISAGTSNTIKGNMIGLQKDGETMVTSSNQVIGIDIYGTATSNIVGGTNAGDGNVISGNGQQGGSPSGTGVYIYSSTAGSNSVFGNRIGTKANGTAVVASNVQADGITIGDAPSNVIGGVGSRGNIISGNTNNGINIYGGNASGNLIKGNYIGPKADGTSITGSSQDYGIYIASNADNNFIGGYAGAAGTNPEGNVIAHNTVNGIYITGAGCSGNLISRNLIYTNSGQGIELNGTGNGNKTAPAITLYTGTRVFGTGTTGDTIEVFSQNTGLCEDAQGYIGSAIVAAGTWSVTGNSSTGITATARTLANNNTSEFSSTCNVSLPIELLSFTATLINNAQVRLDWVTATEINNNYFTI